MRKKIFRIIAVDYDEQDKYSSVYDAIMMMVIIISLIPLTFKTNNYLFIVIDRVSIVVFIIDYLLRWITADFEYKNNSLPAFVIYPFTPMAVIDLVVILSSFTVLGNGFKILKVLRLFRTFRVLRAFKVLRYSKSLVIILDVLQKEKQALTAVATLTTGYILFFCACNI